MAYVKRIPIKTNLKNSIKYILNDEKTDSGILVSENKCSVNKDIAYKMMQKTKEEFKKTDKIQGIHFIQSFKEGEIENPELAHEIGKRWAEKFLSKYEYLISTHNDKGHMHNHIIINSVNYEDGKKYLKNDKELREIRTYSDEVCKEYGLDIIQSNKENRNKSYKEWKSSKKNISWKDKIKIDINSSIEDSKSYSEFIELMKSKGYKLRYGNVKHNTFKHSDMGRAVRGKSLGVEYTEDKIKSRIEEYRVDKLTYLEKYRQVEKLNFVEEKFYKNSFSNREITKGDINLTIQEVKSYGEFIEKMKLKGYEMKFGNVKYNTFKHRDMKKAVRGTTIGDEYTEESIKTRIEDLQLIKKAFRNKDSVSISRNTYFERKYLNNKFKYLGSRTIGNTNRSYEEKSAIKEYYSNLWNMKFENKAYSLLEKYEIKSNDELRNKLNVIKNALRSKESEHRDRVLLLNSYKHIYDKYVEGKTNGLSRFKSLDELKESMRHQNGLLTENIHDLEKYKLIEKELRDLERTLKSKKREYER